MKLRKFVALGLAVIAPFSLTGCLILPGEFVSEMTVMKSGDFTFNYKGQIQLLGLANLMNDTMNGIGADASTEEFTATCWVGSGDDEDGDLSKKEAEAIEKKKEKAIKDSDENEATLSAIKNNKKSTAASAAAQEGMDKPEVEEKQSDESASDAAEEAPDAAVDAGEAAAKAVDAAVDAAAEAVKAAEDDMTERDCTKKEIAEQKAEWDETQKAKKDREAEQKKMFSMLLGGIDPNDPKTIDRFTKEVERLAAWNKVEHLGNGLFKIDYSTKGRLADDFAFPVIPRYSIGSPMIHITRWDNGRLRVEAPAFHSDPDFSAMTMMGGSAMMGMAAGGKPNIKPVEIKGTFTLITDAKVLANNTEEGPQDERGMQKLSWDIGPETFGPPMALLKLVQ
jgi:hypothetical protein